MRMPRDPLMLHKHPANMAAHEESEMGWGLGMFPHPSIDYSIGGSKSRFPIADPDVQAQLRTLAAIKRTDVALAGEVANPFVAGNTDRFGAQPPLVRQRAHYIPSRYKPLPRARMHREW